MVILGFMHNDNLHPSDCFRITDNDFSRTDISQFVNNTTSEHLTFNPYNLLSGEFLMNSWRQVMVGDQKSIRIIRSPTGGEINEYSLKELFDRLIINMCISICKTTDNLRVVIIDKNLNKYKRLTKIAPCLFIAPISFTVSSRVYETYESDDENYSVTCDYSSGSEDEYNTEQNLEPCDIKVSLTESVSDGIKRSLKNEPFMVESSNVYDGDMIHVGSSIVLNLRDRTIRGGLFHCLYVGLCDSNTSDRRAEELESIFGPKLMTHLS
jgi:hypothetical protein